MPEMLDEFPEPTRHRTGVPWREFVDGEPRLITNAEIDAMFREVHDLQSDAHRMAKYHGCRARTRRTDGGLAVQFYDPNKEES